MATRSGLSSSVSVKESKKDFLEKIKGLLSKKGLKVEDLQVKLKEDDVDHFMSFIGKDWYTFGRCMGVEDNVMEHIKKTGKDKPGRKKQLLQYLIKLDNSRYEDIIYGLYNSENKQDPSIHDILDYLCTRRKYEDISELDDRPPSSHRPPPPRRKPSQSYETPPWQAEYDERKRWQPSRSKLRPLSELTPDNYQDHFYGMLWYEEREHMEKLKKKCDGKYNLFVYSDNCKVPYRLQPDRRSHYGYIKGPSFTDDKIEYATQASDSVIIADQYGYRICTAYKHQYNFDCLEGQMYIRFQKSPLTEIRKKCPKVDDNSYEIHAKFEVKHSYFNHLHDAVVKVPDYVRMSLIPQETSFTPLFPGFDPVHLSSLEFMKLDTDKQWKALLMITSTSFQLSPVNPPPPVILYGPFGSGKTRILVRAAYEIMMNGINSRRCTRILICAHHPESIDIFIHRYFGCIERQRRLPFQVIEVGRYEKDRGATFSHFYITMDHLSKQQNEICQSEYLVVITTYTMSLNLQSIFKEGFFTHLFLDEAAQVREPEAIAPLAMATRDAKIVLAGDDKQVGPNILVLGEEARKYDLHISLLERMMQRYDTLGPVAQSYVTKLSVNYRSHESLMPLPKLFYQNLQLNYDKRTWEHRGPTGYSFVCSDSRLVPSYIDPNHPLVEACIVLEEVLQYMKKIMEVDKKFRPRNICIISSTRKQLNQIKDMAYAYEEYRDLRNVSFKPSFTIQGHEFEAIFLGLFEPIENDEMGAFFIKSLFNPYVFNTVITRASTRVVAFGKPKVVIEFENKSPRDGQYNMKFKCWHEYLKLCIKNGTLQHCESIEELEELMKPKSTVVTETLITSIPSMMPTKPAKTDVVYSSTCTDVHAATASTNVHTATASANVHIVTASTDVHAATDSTNVHAVTASTNVPIVFASTIVPDSTDVPMAFTSTIVSDSTDVPMAFASLPISVSTSTVYSPPPIPDYKGPLSEEEEDPWPDPTFQPTLKDWCPEYQEDTNLEYLITQGPAPEVHDHFGRHSFIATTLVEQSSPQSRSFPSPYAQWEANEISDRNASTVEDIMKVEDSSAFLTNATADTVDEKKEILDEITQLQKGLDYLKQKVENKMRSKLDMAKLHQRCEELAKKNEELRKYLRQAEQKMIVASCTIVERLQVSIISNGPQYIDWKEYGMIIDIPQDVFSFSNNPINEYIAVEALAGGKFEFPDGMNLVSAVYAISVTKPLSKKIKLQIEHCVNLTDKAELKYLKFAVAPHESGPPYKFRYVKGGKFAVGNQYGVIARDTFSLFCIGLEGESNDDDDSSSSDEDEQMTQENGHDEPEEGGGGGEGGGGREEGGGGGGGGGGREEGGGGEGGGKREEGGGGGSGDNERADNEDDQEGQPIAGGSRTVESTKSSTSEPNETSLQTVVSSRDDPGQGDQKPPDISRKSMPKKISYNGQMFYKSKEVIFAAVKQLKVLLKYFKNNSHIIENGQAVHFYFTDHDYIELIFDNEKQKKPITGWIVQPHLIPCKLLRSTIDEYGSNNTPATCLVHVNPDTSNSATVSTLSYCVPLKGVDPYTQIFIIRSLEKVISSTCTSVRAADSIPPTSSQKEQTFNEELAKEVFRQSFADILDVVSTGNNRSILAAKLYSAKVISDSSYDAATDTSPRDDFTKSITLMNDIKAKIIKDPKSLKDLIGVFERIEEFQTIVEDMKDKLKK